jgi:diketogulonate reductase-like aldo/keto reductase
MMQTLDRQLLSINVVEDIAKRRGIAPSSVLLRWGLQKGTGMFYSAQLLVFHLLSAPVNGYGHSLRGQQCSKPVAGVIPKSGSPVHIQENARVFEFELGSDEMLRLDTLGGEERKICWDPSTIK